MAIKLDMSKANDKVEWSLLKKYASIRIWTTLG